MTSFQELLKTIYIDAALANLQDLSMVPSNKESDVKNGIRCMQISPNGDVIATGDRTGNLRSVPGIVSKISLKFVLY